VRVLACGQQDMIKLAASMESALWHDSNLLSGFSGRS
jgi:hypothetical protein